VLLQALHDLSSTGIDILAELRNVSLAGLDQLWVELKV